MYHFEGGMQQLNMLSEHVLESLSSAWRQFGEPGYPKPCL
jgi:hypothetical protein